MNEALTMVLVWTAGGALGATFFGGLWWTIRHAVSAPRPALWFLGSLVLRIALTLSGLYLVSSGHWQRLMLALLGFIMARAAVIRLTRTSGNERTCQVLETPHAP